MLEKIGAAWDFIWTTLTYIIYPPLCPVCKEIVDERGQICKNCQENILKLSKLKNFPKILDGVFNITKYSNGTRDLLIKLKFKNDMQVLATIKNILAEVSNSAELKKFLASADVATYVPLHADRLKQRGFNQVELIFKDFLTEKKLSPQNFLIRTKSTPRLFSYKLAEERQEILKDAFKIVENLNLRGKKILLVDDIFTTGSTTAECAQVLKNSGASKVFVLSFASNS